MTGLTRRQFFRIGGATLAAGALPGEAARAMELEPGGRAYGYARVAVDRNTTAFTVSPFGTLKTPQQVFLEGGKVVASAGLLHHPDTRGHCAPVDLVAHMTAADPDRVLSPLKRVGPRGEGRWKRISWDQALGDIAHAVNAALAKRGADAIWLARGADTADGAWQRFMDTLGSPSLADLDGGGASRLAQRSTWGEDATVPDFANARYILNFGSNLYETLPAYAAAAVDARRDKRAKLVTFDPRLSLTAGRSDEWVPLAPGSDGLVALAMANVIMQERLADTAFINAWTNVKADALAKHLAQFTPEAAERQSGVKAETIRRLAVEYAGAKPAVVFSHGGAAAHANGTETERACMLLPVITGNVEIQGGNCLARRIRWEPAKPVPPAPPARHAMPGALFPQAAKSGRIRVGVLFCHGANPAHEAAGAPYWREVLKDEGSVPLMVALGTHMSETAALADIVLPEASYLESHELVAGASLFPWLGARLPVTPPPGEARETKVILRDIVRALDKDAQRGFERYWKFEDPQEWLAQGADSIPALKADGGLASLKEHGVWPVYGALDAKSGKVVDKSGKAVAAAYGKHLHGGFATASKKIELRSEALRKRGLDELPGWHPPANLAADAQFPLTLVTFASPAHAALATANNKYLIEKDHYNHCQINKATAAKLGVADGELVRITSAVGHLVTRAHVTQSVHPQVVAMAGGFGHRAGGRVARGESRQPPEWAADGEDLDVHFNLWWEDRGVNVADILPLVLDPASGAPASACSVRIEKGRDGDRYGDAQIAAPAQEAFFNKAAGGRS